MDLMDDMDKLIPKHGGYRKLKTFQLARLIFDITTRFCERFIDYRSRTKDQMVQAARSGVQNIAEGSQASATSKKTELKLTNVARASLEELLLDYEDFLRQRNLTEWDKNDRRRSDFVGHRFESADEVARWVKQVSKRDNELPQGIAANVAILLIEVTCKLLDRQIASQAESFKRDGGFTERLYRVRKASRNR